MSDLLPALLGFFFTVTILLVLFDNCSFSMGCGKKHRNPMSMRRWDKYENMESYPKEIAMEEVAATDSPSAIDNVEGYASVDASGTGYLVQPTSRTMAKYGDNPYHEHPYGAPFHGDGEMYSNIGGVPHTTQRAYSHIIPQS